MPLNIPTPPAHLNSSSGIAAGSTDSARATWKCPAGVKPSHSLMLHERVSEQLDGR